MGFSDKLREALGADGVHLEARLPEDTVAAGGTLTVEITATGGNKPARIGGFTARLLRAERHWSDPEGRPVDEADALALVDRSHLTARWAREEVARAVDEQARDLAPGEPGSLTLELSVPTDSPPSSLACTYTINVQADVKDQIDPTANARVRVT